MFYLVRLFRTSSSGGSISSDPERDERRTQRAGSLNIKRWLLNKARYPKSRNLALFCVWEDARAWDPWNHSSPLWGQYPGFSLISSGLTFGSGCSLAAAGWQVSFPSWVCSGLPAHVEAVQSLVTRTSFVYWHGKKQSTSQVAIIKKASGSKCSQGRAEAGSLVPCWWG